MAKRYYWMKIDEEFFRQREIKALRKLDNGDSCVIVYQKMLAYSLRYENRIYFDNVEETFEEEIALVLDEDVEIIKITLAFLERVGLVERINEDELIFYQIDELTGTQSDNMQRVKRLRAKKKEEAKNSTVIDNSNCDDNNVEGEIITNDDEATEITMCNDNNIIDIIEENNNIYVTKCNNNNDTGVITCNNYNVTHKNPCNKNVTLDIELEKEKDIELEIDTETDKDPKESVGECVGKNLKLITKIWDENMEPLYPANRQWFIQVAQKIYTLRCYKAKEMDTLNKKTGS